MGLFGGTRFGGSRRVRGDDRAVTIDIGTATAVGGRADNQDRLAVGPTWAVVSDGAGGHAGGARAAELAVAAMADGLRALDRTPDPALLADLVAGANAAVHDARAEDAAVATMAATLTAAVATAISADGSRWLLANVGDSPAWRAAASDLSRVTREHNVAAELLRAGALSPEAARSHPGRHLITRAMGAAAAVEADIAEVALAPGDALVLASDGIEVLEPTELLGVLEGAADAQEAADRLVGAAVARGAPDNVTAVVVRHLPSFG
jgi:serine/threonine protein phosphatase PrpC